MDKKYFITVADTAVTSDNCSNVTGNRIKGKISYDPDTETLMLNNAVIDGDIYPDDFYGEVENLNIILIGENIINGDIESVNNILTIKGEGSLEINGIVNCNRGENFIVENCTIKVKDEYNDYVVFGEECILTIKKADFSIDSLGVALIGFKEIKLIDCEITYPYNANIGGYYDKHISIYDELGLLATEVVIERT